MDEVFTQAAYQALVQEIFRRFPSVQKDGFLSGAYKPGLEAMQAFDEALGHPSRAFRSIHVAGTNGKGSVASMLASACHAAGMRTGLFTSPHLLDFRERARVDGEMIPKEYVFSFLSQWMPWITEHKLSFFEITTGLAFKWFADSEVDVAVVEVGLGGRLDATNILMPDLAVVTTIGLDHMALLGDTLGQIAAEKAGIFKAGVPAVVGESNPETDPVFNDRAWMFCPLTYADKVRPSLWYRHGTVLRQMDLLAPVQEKNLRTVLAAIDILKQHAHYQALTSDDAVLQGIIHAARDMHLRGRWERLSSQPYVVADIGHNAHALQYNFARLKELVAQGQFSSIIIVYGIMADKDLDAILPLMPEDATYIFTAPDTPRALPAGDLLRRYLIWRRGAAIPGPERAFHAPTVREAVQMAVQLSQSLSRQLSRSASAENPAPPVIYIGGSTFVVAEALPLFA